MKYITRRLSINATVHTFLCIVNLDTQILLGLFNFLVLIDMWPEGRKRW